MRDSGDDKTKIKPDVDKPAVNKHVEAENAAGISPAKNKKSIASDNEGKTRIADPAQRQQPADDKTRIAAKTRLYKTSSNANENISERTRFKAATIVPDNKQAATANEITAGSESQPLQNEQGEHGTLKNRFILEKVLGVGGMGIVYKAKDKLKVEAQDSDPYVAIKVLSEEFKTHPEAFISLQRESRKSQRIAHPNIVNVHDFDRDGATVFMTMEFLDGSPLDQLIRQYKSTGLPTDDAWGIIKGMSAALSYAHAEKIIHSDFKPGNVFVTKKGLAKVFDFGIARAVAKVEHLDDDPEDRTVFDAGNLGALTPAYASLEMLEGKEPDVRDDIYALGCVAYELFTGVHPYNKVPADEAEHQGLKAKRITNIKKNQWRAIEKAIAFRRENRIATVDEFIEAVSPKSNASNWIITSLAVLLSVVITSYFVFFQEKQLDPYSEFDIRNELELKIKIDFYKKDLESLIKEASFTNRWQESTWKDVSDLTILTKGEDPWLDEKKHVIYKLYLNKIIFAIKQHKYTLATGFIENAKRYTEDAAELELQTKKMIAAIASDKSRKAAQSRQQENKQAQQSRQQLKAQQQAEKQETVKRFDIALANVNKQLQCQQRLNMRDFETAINKLQDLDPSRYKTLQTKIVKSLAACIKQMAKAFPERALEAKKYSLRIFASNRVLLNIKIASKDPCDKSLAGLGARGKRAVCKDKIKNTGSGPELVVIPGNSKIKAFAIGKYEVSIDELNKFCKTSSVCETKNSNGELPASEINFSLVKNYIKWLSKMSGQKYRLPRKNEWVYAAKSNRQNLDANRNCKLSTRGIEKGDELVKVNIGKQNGWGLVNHVGNVQEWVYEQGRKLVAVGGSYKQSMRNCDVTTLNQQSGSADKATGFRVLRELRADL
ncbi:MAG: protein kinase domain-containing protein [Gammaproteobacteria bacterium]